MRSTFALVVATAACLTAGPSHASAVATQWSFSTDAGLDDVAARIRVVADQPTTCRIRGEIAGPVPQAWSGFMLLETSDGEATWVFESGVYGAAHVHAEGAVNTREVVGGSRWESIGQTLTVDVADEAEMTAVASEVAPWPDELRAFYPDPAPGEHAIAFDVDCDDPVSVTLAGGLDAGIFGTLYAYTGAGVSTPAATGYVGLNHEREFSAPDVSFRFASSPEAGATRIALRHPAGEASWTLTTPLAVQTAGADGGPGLYAITIDRVAAVGAFGAFLAEFHPLTTLDDLAASDRA